MTGKRNNGKKPVQVKLGAKHWCAACGEDIVLTRKGWLHIYPHRTCTRPRPMNRP